MDDIFPSNMTMWDLADSTFRGEFGRFGGIRLVEICSSILFLEFKRTMNCMNAEVIEEIKSLPGNDVGGEVSLLTCSIVLIVERVTPYGPLCLMEL